MADAEKFDGILLNIAQQQGSVEIIMDTFFGFLQRKTDFYTGSTDEKAAEELVLKYFRKHWKTGQKRRDEISEKNRLADDERKRKAEEKKAKDEEEYRKREEEKANKPKDMQIEEVTEEEAEQIKADKAKAAAGGSVKEKIKAKEKETADKKDKSASSATDTDKDEAMALKAKGELPEKKKDDDDEEDQGPVPHNGGGTTDKYTWTQTLTSMEIFVPVKPGVKAKQIVCDIGSDTLKVGVKGEPLILNGKMGGKVKPDDCMWTLVDNKIVQISIEKFLNEQWWSCVMKGDPEINTKKIVPENSKLSDLDGESRTMVEKMMYDQRQKALGKPTSDQEKQHDLLEKFKMAHPEMDFSKTKINYGGGAPGSSMSMG